jgi:hypothetical protein
MRPSFVLVLGFCAVGALSAGCAGKARRTICTADTLDCMCTTSVTSVTHSDACSVASHPGWSCCQSPGTSDCMCRPASCPPTLTSVDDCAAASAAAAPLVSTPVDGGGDASPARP